MAVVFSIRGGWTIPSGGEAHYLACAKHFWNPEWCPNDFFLNTASGHLLFDSTFGALTPLLPLDGVAVIGRLLAWILLAWAWWRMFTAIVAVPLLSVVAAGIFVTLSYSCHLAGEWVVAGVEAKSFAYVFVLLAIEALARNQWNRAWLFSGAATAFHPLVGGWSAIAMAGVWSFSGPDAPSLRQIASGLAAGAALALIGVIPALMLTWNTEGSIVAEAHQISVFKRLPHHLWPLSFSWAAISRHLPLVAAWFALCVVVPTDDRQRGIRGMTHWAVLFSVAGWAIALGFQDRPATAASLLRFYWFRLSDAMLPIGVAILSALFFKQQLRSRPWFGSTLVIAATALMIAVYVRATYLREVSVVNTELGIAYADDWRQSCAWIRVNTEPDAVFVTPPLSQTFHWYAERSEVVNRKNCPQDAWGIVEWWRRMQDLYGDAYGTSLHEGEGINKQGTMQALEAARSYNANYIIATKEPPLDLPLVGPTGLHYVVYRVPPADEVHVP